MMNNGPRHDNYLRKDAPSFQESASDFKIIDEEVLIKRTFDTDPKAGCEILFQKYYTILCSHAVRFVYSREVAEDIVSEIFCKFWSDRIYETINISFRAYLFKAVRFSAYNYIRWELSRKNKSVGTENLETAVSALKPEQVMLYDELAAEIEHIINELPHQCKNVFLLSRFENKKYSEIAAELNISMKAVEAHISKALDILRKTLKAEDLLPVMLLLGSINQ
jgi:RNA polymerase sigma-70 factor (ECF subfamily)